MKSNAYDTLKKLLLSVKEFTTEDNNLNIPKIQKDGFNASNELISLLMSDESIKQLFFAKQNNVLVYNRDKFLDFISNKNFLANSYTKFSNKIGLAVGNRFFKQNAEVVLNFPFKDCVLEGGQTFDDKKQNELFFNETLAVDEIDKLLSPKVLTNAKRYTQDGVSDEVGFNRDENGTVKDNLIIKGNNLLALHTFAHNYPLGHSIIKGNNLLALHTLKSNFAGKVKLIYIDPPYNTGNDSFNYNDNFNHSTWLTFMKNRLEVARDLLRDDGVIFVQCDDNEQAYLKVLMDEVFGIGSYLRTVSIKKKQSAGVGQDAFILDVTEYNLIYIKNNNFINFDKYYIDVEFDQKQMNNYSLYLTGSQVRKKIKEIQDAKGNTVNLYKVNTEVKTLRSGNRKMEQYIKNFDNHFVTYNPQSSLAKKIIKEVGKDGYFEAEYKPIRGKNKDKLISVFFYKGRIVQKLKGIAYIDKNKIVKKQTIDNFWKDLSWDTIGGEGGVNFSNAKKPEKLLQRIIDMTTKKGDLVLDYHLGSGTTFAVAHKMGRQYIGIEQMDYIEDIAVKRMQKVIGEKVKKDGELLASVDFDNGGISKNVNWQGGGEFIYCELKQNTAELIDKITNAKNTVELLAIKDSIKDYTFIDYRINLEFLQDKDNQEFKDFLDLPFEQQQKILISLFDKNQMFVNYSERDDSLFDVSDKEKAISKDFYMKKNQ